MEARPLAELPVPGLQRRRHRRILDDLVDARAHLFHLLEVGNFRQLRQPLRRQALLVALRGDEQDVADNVRPPIIHQVFRLIAARDQRIEILHPPALPAGLQALRPVRIRLPVIAHIDGRGRALEHVEMLRPGCEVRHALHGGRAGADDADHLVLQARQPAFRPAARIGIIPAARMEAVPLERLHARNAGQLRPVQRTIAHHHELRGELVAPVRLDRPGLLLLVPLHAGHAGAQQGLVEQVEALRDPLRMREDFRRLRILLLRHEAGLFQQRQVDIALDIARRAGIPVPVPGAAKRPAGLDHADVVEARLAQARRRQHPAKPAADHRHFHVILHRRALHTLRIRVFQVMGELPGHVHILLVAILAHALVALRQIARLQRGRVKSKIKRAGIGHGKLLRKSAGPASRRAGLPHPAWNLTAKPPRRQS